ncbi:GNAT family N-acetyltransferase [Aquirufa lenticrescens]|uniref:GNAT family N-acetyltransferase n=1 Tax=Aquirufa lenticrescens TaxID=2696560 RepID=UPI001CAA50AA|nr:GNAT family N-acetyltransferase [Aquirufa lenticrescens]UAJ13352.1 GNAT family N-acetyltransferase [Aquirufa lenticrescens]
MLEIKSPQTDSDWKAYYALRFSVLREPWNQPLGSEVLADEDKAIHAIAVENEEVLGVARMHESAEKQGQVRCVATATEAQGKGIGKAIMAYLEEKAKQKGWTEIVLEARENAVAFYQAIGYSIVAESYLLFGEIQHYRMQKSL